MTSTPFTDLLWQVETDGVATITINRPDKRNALNTSLLHQLDHALLECERRDDIRGLMITGAGDRAFVAGADIDDLLAKGGVEMKTFSALGQRIFRRLELLPKPSVAAINGPVLGGGLELALSCTIRVAAEHAKLGVPETKLGIIPGWGATQRLPRAIGRGRAMDMLLTGDPIDAATALEFGLVQYVTKLSGLADFCRHWLHKVLSNGPLATAMVLQAVDVGFNTTMEQGLHFEAAAFGLIRSTADCQEGLEAFRQKRKPVFRGR